jgi:hypothetical protein
MTDPVSRLQLAQQEIDRVFGAGYAAANPGVVAAVMASASSDFAALAIARALQDIAAALVADEEAVSHNGGIVRAHGLVGP